MNDDQKPYELIAFSRSTVSAIFGFGLLYLITLAVLWPSAVWHQVFLGLFLFPILIWISVCDLQTFELPDLGTLSIVVLSLGYLGLLAPHLLFSHVSTAVGMTTFCWLLGEMFFRKTGTDGLGIGDAKLFGAGGLLLGPTKIPELLLLPSLGGIALSIILNVRAKETAQGIPFGPFIAYAVFILSFLTPLFF